MNEFEQEYELTKEDYEKFKNEFMYWIDTYGLKGWEIHFLFDEDKENDYRAMVSRDLEGRLAIVSLTKKWKGCQPIDYNVRKCAYHEAGELLLSKINDLCRSRTVMAEQITEEIHNIIRTLESVHFDEYYGRDYKNETS
jgi:hypothetical protein